MRILFAALLLLAAQLLPTEGWLRALCFAVPYLFVGWDVLRSAAKGVLRGQVFDENFLMALATVGAFATAEYAEAVFVMLFYRVGELFERAAVSRSRASIAQLMDIMPEHANVERGGAVETVEPSEVAVGETILVKPGERVPLDGIVVEGVTALDTSALTGEAVPRDAGPGDGMISGCVNLRGLVRVKVTKAYEDSTVSRILELVESSAEKKAKTESFITRFARYYTPCVVASAVLLAVIPPLVTGDWGLWFHRALIFLVVSCPCALVISIPLSFFGGIGGASRMGILVKGSNFLEQLAGVDTVVFYKTGTLTQGSVTVAELHPSGDFSAAELLELAAHAELYSDHPIAASIRDAYGKPDPRRVGTVAEHAGLGVCAVVDGCEVIVGNASITAVSDDAEYSGTVAHVSVDGVHAGCIVISDEIKLRSAVAVERLRELGVGRTVMLTGDAQAAAARVASELSLDEYHAQLLPADKVTWVERFLEEKRGVLAFVGDGLNDAPVLMRADVGIAMGALGSDAAIEAADIVIMDDDPTKVALAVGIARRTLRIVRQNIVFALGIKFAVLILGALGAAGMWAAVFADVGVSVIAILNAARALKTQQ